MGVVAAGSGTLHVGILVAGTVVGVALGVAAVAWPRGRRLLVPMAAVLGVISLWPSGVTTGWVILAVGLPALAAVVPALNDDVPEIASTGLAVVTAGLGALALGPAAASAVSVPRAEVVVGATALAGVASLAADRHLYPPAVVAVGAWSAFGLFLCNPDTEGASLVGALLAATAATIAGLSWRRGQPRRPSGAARSATIIGSATPLVVLLMWIGAQGAGGREETIISGYACLGVLLVLPVAAVIARLVPDGDRHRPSRVPAAIAMAVQAPLVVVCSRWGGVRTTAVQAVLLAAAALVLATAILSLVLGSDRAARFTSERARLAR